jgi:hypothetical protein
VDRSTLLEALADGTSRPDAALAEGLAALETIVADLLAVVEKAADTNLPPEHDWLLFHGLHLLGAGRERRLYEPLMRLLRRSPEDLEPLLGDAVTETLPRIVCGTYDPDVGPEPLFAALHDLDADEFVRAALFGALAWLTWRGLIPLDDTEALLRRYDAERLAPADDHSWFGWREAVALLGLSSLSEQVLAAYGDDRVLEQFDEPADFLSDLEAALEAPEDDARFETARLGFLDHPSKALAWIDYDATEPTTDDPFDEDFGGPPEPVMNPWRDVGRNDPCPCGSGKKAKKCCLPAVEAERLALAGRLQ